MLIDWGEPDDRNERERYGEREREQDRDGMQPAFELRREDEVHKSDGSSYPLSRLEPIRVYQHRSSLLPECAFIVVVDVRILGH
jgi:hypothetical protein